MKLSVTPFLIFFLFISIPIFSQDCKSVQQFLDELPSKFNKSKVTGADLKYDNEKINIRKSGTKYQLVPENPLDDRWYHSPVNNAYGWRTYYGSSKPAIPTFYDLNRNFDSFKNGFRYYVYRKITDDPSVNEAKSELTTFLRSLKYFSSRREYNFESEAVAEAAKHEVISKIKSLHANFGAAVAGVSFNSSDEYPQALKRFLSENCKNTTNPNTGTNPTTGTNPNTGNPTKNPTPKEEPLRILSMMVEGGEQKGNNIKLDEPDFFVKVKFNKVIKSLDALNRKFRLYYGGELQTLKNFRYGDEIELKLQSINGNKKLEAKTMANSKAKFLLYVSDDCIEMAQENEALRQEWMEAVAHQEDLINIINELTKMSEEQLMDLNTWEKYVYENESVFDKLNGTIFAKDLVQLTSAVKSLGKPSLLKLREYFIKYKNNDITYEYAIKELTKMINSTTDVGILEGDKKNSWYNFSKIVYKTQSATEAVSMFTGYKGFSERKRVYDEFKEQILDNAWQIKQTIGDIKQYLDQAEENAKGVNSILKRVNKTLNENCQLNLLEYYYANSLKRPNFDPSNLKPIEKPRIGILGIHEYEANNVAVMGNIINPPNATNLKIRAELADSRIELNVIHISNSKFEIEIKEGLKDKNQIIISVENDLIKPIKYDFDYEANNIKPSWQLVDQKSINDDTYEFRLKTNINLKGRKIEDIKFYFDGDEINTVKKVPSDNHSVYFRTEMIREQAMIEIFQEEEKFAFKVKRKKAPAPKEETKPEEKVTEPEETPKEEKPPKEQTKESGSKGIEVIKRLRQGVNQQITFRINHQDFDTDDNLRIAQDGRGLGKNKIKIISRDEFKIMARMIRTSEFWIKTDSYQGKIKLNR